MSKSSPREVAFELLLAVETSDSYANLLLPKLIARAELDTRDAGLAQELSFGTLRSQLLYDQIIESCANRALSKIDIKSVIALRLGLHQLLSMRVPSHAAINEAVNLAKKNINHGSGGFVNGILRNAATKDRESWIQNLENSTKPEDEKLAVRFSHPVWIIKAFRAALALDGRSDQLQDLLAEDNIAPKVNLVALPGFDDPTNELLTPGNASPIGYVLSQGDPAQIQEVQNGTMRVQDQGSQLAALALLHVSKINPQEQWLDMCAGPGGKAALLAASAKLSGSKLQANEISDHRAKLVNDALASVDNSVKVTALDGRDLGETKPEVFHRVLLDAPCTGLGSLRRRSEARWKKSPEDVAELTKLQQELIASAFETLKPGGIMAYVTCSPHVSETVGIVDWLLRKTQARAELLDANAVLSEINPDLELNRSRKTAQLWPHVHRTDAMFIALIKKQIK